MTNSTLGFTVRSATDEDVSEIVPNLIPEGLAEYQRAGYNPALRMALDISTHNAKVIISPDGKPCAIYGIATDGGSWMSMTNEIRKHKLKFMRFFKDYFKKNSPTFLWSVVDIQNTTLHKFLRLLGFKALGLRIGHTRNIYYVEFARLNYG